MWPDVISYNAIINACAAGSHWQGALCFLMTAKEALVQCDVLLLVVVALPPVFMEVEGLELSSFQKSKSLYIIHKYTSTGTRHKTCMILGTLNPS